MLRRHRGALVAAVSTAMALVTTGCGTSVGSGGGPQGAGAPDTTPDTRVGGQGGTFRLGIVEPVAIDPYNAQESEGILVTSQLFAGLTRVDLNNQTVPYVAESWTSDKACLRWTFKLKAGQRFSNGESVDAQAFIRGWTRAASKQAASDVAYHMRTIAGFDALQGGLSRTFSGLSSPDPRTLVVRMGRPDCEFYKRTTHVVFSPVPAVAGAADNKTYNDMPIGDGPFKMAEPWQHDQRITLVRNDDFTASERAHLDRVEISILNSGNANDLEYKNFQDGAADWARIPPALYQQAERMYRPKSDWIKKDVFGINYLEVAVQTPPMNSVDARKAVSYAIDRDAIIRGVFQGYALKATSFLSPPFATAGVYQPGLCESCGQQDVAKAKELAAKAGLKPGTTVDLIYNTGGGHEAWVQAVAVQLKDVLGLNVNLRGMPFAELLRVSTQPSRSGLRRAAWSADYPTPDNFLYPLLHTQPADNPGDNRGRYSNPAFDALVDKARGTKDQKIAANLYRQAERIAIGQDLADIPLWYRVQFRLFNSAKFQGVNMDFSENPTLGTISLRQ